MPSMMRRMRTRLPTYLSTGFGALVDIRHSLVPRGHETNETGLCLRQRYHQSPGIGSKAGNLSQSRPALRDAPSDHQDQRGDNDDPGGNVAEAGENRRRNRRRRSGIEHPFDAETEP